MQTGSVGKADDLSLLSEFLVRMFKVRTIILFGSLARGDHNSTSDIDLLLITREKVEKRQIEKTIPKSLVPKRNLAFSVYSQNQIDSAYKEGILFLVHVLKEGRIVYDDGFFKELSSSPFTLSPRRIRLSLRIFEQRLEAGDDLEMFDHHFVKLLSNYYSIAKSIAFILLAIDGQYLFNKKKAFETLSVKYPIYRGKIKKLSELEPFYLRAARRSDIEYPFDPADAEQKVIEAREYLKELIALGERKIACRYPNVAF